MAAVLIRLRSELRARWRTWTAIAVLIGLSGGVVLFTAAGARRTDTAYSRFLRRSHASDVLLGPEAGGYPAYYEALARRPEVASMAVGVGFALFTDSQSEVQGLAAADRSYGRTIERFKLLEGRLPNPSRPDEALADRVATKQFHLHAGSRLQLQAMPTAENGPDFAHARPVDLRIVGVVVARDNVVPVNALATLPTLTLTPAFLAQMDALEPSLPPDVTYHAYDGAFVRLRPGVSRSAFRARAEALLADYPDAHAPLFFADEHLQAANVQKAIRPQATALALFSLLAAISALFVVGQIVSRQLFIAAAENPTVRALGMSRTQLLVVSLAEAGVVGIVGAAIAVAIAALASPLMPIGPARIAEVHPGMALDWTVLGLGLLGIVVLLVLRVAWPAWRLASASAEVGGAVEQPTVRSSRLARTARRAGAPASAAVGAQLALEPGRGRTAVPVRSALTGTVLAITAVTAAFTFGSNLVRLVHTPKLFGRDWDLALDSQFGEMPTKVVNGVLGHDHRVAAWTFGNHGALTIANREVASISLSAGTEEELWPTMLEGRPPHGPDEIVLGTKSLEAAHKKVGDRIEIAAREEPGHRTVRVVGRATFPFFGQGSFTTTGLGVGAALRDPNPAADNSPGFNFVLVRMRPGQATRTAVASVGRELMSANVCPQDQECVPDALQRPVEILNYSRIQATPLALAGLLAALAVATVAHLLVTSIRRRRRDLAVLKTMGFVRSQVSAAVAWQATVLVGLALLVGLPLGIAAGRWVWQVFARQLGVPTDPRIPVVTVLVAVPVALLVANVLAAGPGWVAGRLKPAPVLRTE